MKTENEEVKQNVAPQKENTKETKTDLLNALKSDFATTVNRIFINSLGKDVGFREITVLEQKTLSRIMIDNENRKDVIFDAQCALINTVCLEEDFDIYKLSEFDRLKLLIAIYQANMYKNDITFNCPNCGEFNSYRLDFDNVVHKLDEVVIEDKPFDYENKNFKYNFIIAYPSVKYISKFHKSNVIKYRGTSKNKMRDVETDVNMDYVNLYIKDVVITNKNSNTTRTIHLYDYAPEEIEEILSVFPQDVLYSENGVLKFVTTEFIKKINDTFDVQKCASCGEIYEGTVNSSSNFL